MAAYGGFMYRRNGRFYARLRIPKQLIGAYGRRTHLRTSLGTADLAVARVRIHEIVLRWRLEFERLRSMIDLDRVASGSPMLIGEGLLTLGSAARESGIPVSDLIMEAINRRLELRVEGAGWPGCDVPTIELQYEHGGSHEEGTYSPAMLLVDDSAAGRPRDPVVGTLYVRRDDLVLVRDGTHLETCLLFRDRRHKQAVVFALPGISVASEDLLIDRLDVERLRADMASKITPEMLKVAQQARRAAVAPKVAKHKYAAMRSSELLNKFFTAKSPDWGEATKMDMKTMCGAFVDLMEDPALGDIDGAMVLDYRSRLARLPNHIGIARRKARTESTKELLDALPDMGRMAAERVNEYVGKLSEFLGWATKHGFIERNPAAGALKRTKKARREQDERQPMSPENLEKIFSVEWFENGRGRRTAKGLHHSFQPHYYWLPLLGLYVGGRLNELSQLYLDDVKQSESGQHYIDFNLDQPDKKDVDESDTLVGEKRLKTVNAMRVVPLHSRLVALGFVEYVAALRADGQHQRVFPELLWNSTKGYSKQSSRWFNELFMGKKLRIVRDGSQVFHSFRHNFVTALIQLDVPERVVSELAGHERGHTMSGKRYAKDREADLLAPHIERLAYELPVIAQFDVADGLVALEHALARKKNHP